jgi:uncharacterized protein YggE
MKRLLCLTAVVLAFALSVSAQEVANRSLITVSGQAEVMIVPDEVLFRFEASNLNMDLNVAKAKTDSEIKSIFALTRSYKIEPQHVQTDYLRIAERYTELAQTKKRQFEGYYVSQKVVILLKDISRFDNFLADLVKAGISDVDDIAFRASQMRKYMDQARSMAMKAAREKATALAGEIGQTIGKAVNITEAGLSVSSAYNGDDNNNSNFSNNVSMDVPNGVPDNQGTIAPGMISIVARVKVSFELR